MYENVWASMRKYRQVWASMSKYDKVWASMRLAINVAKISYHENITFDFKLQLLFLTCFILNQDPLKVILHSELVKSDLTTGPISNVFSTSQVYLM